MGWFNYTDLQLAENIRRALDRGFGALKLKVGSPDPGRDLRRAHLLRKLTGPQATLMLDANQRWTLHEALTICPSFADMNPYWIEEPLHPDDLLGHQKLSDHINPLRIATGEHLPNAITFKNYLQSGAMAFCQPDVVRVGGVSEFLAISLMAKKAGIPVVPHVGDMGQIHQHLVIFNHIALDHDVLFLEHIPHLQPFFVHPVSIQHGRYRTPHEPGISMDLKP